MATKKKPAPKPAPAANKKAVKKKSAPKKSAPKKAAPKKSAANKAVPRKKAVPGNKAAARKTGEKRQVSSEQRHHLICQQAYYIFLERDPFAGNAVDDWAAAEIIVDEICEVCD